MNDRIYIEDFCYDLNYTRIILYIGEVDSNRLRKALEKSVVNKMYRFDNVLLHQNHAARNFFFVENCDLQDLAWSIHAYIADGYDVYILHEDDGRYYVEKKL